MSTAEKSTKTIDFWRWRQQDPKPGELRRTMFQLTRVASGAFSEARAIPAARPADKEIDPPEFADTTPEIGRLATE